MFLKGGSYTRKLSDEQREMIRWLVRVNQRELAKHFGVSWWTIQRIQSETKKYGYKGKPVWVKIPKKDWATRKTAPRWAETLAKKRKNQKWVRTVEQFKKYIKRPDALYHAKINSFKTHCQRRHPFTPENTYVQIYKGRAMRRCLTCFNQYVKERNAKKNTKRKTDSARRRGIKVKKGVRKQQRGDLRDVKQNWLDERVESNSKRKKASQIQVVPVTGGKEPYAKEIIQHVTKAA